MRGRFFPPGKTGVPNLPLQPRDTLTRERLLFHRSGSPLPGYIVPTLTATGANND